MHLKSLSASALALILIVCALLYHLGTSGSRKTPSNTLNIINFCNIDWTLAGISGATVLFLSTYSVSTYYLRQNCSETIMAAVGIVPVAGETGLCTCVGVGAIWAISAFCMGAAVSAGWFYDSGSNTQNA